MWPTHRAEVAWRPAAAAAGAAVWWAACHDMLRVVLWHQWHLLGQMRQRPVWRRLHLSPVEPAAVVNQARRRCHVREAHAEAGVRHMRRRQAPIMHRRQRDRSWRRCLRGEVVISCVGKQTLEVVPPSQQQLRRWLAEVGGTIARIRERMSERLVVLASNEGVHAAVPGVEAIGAATPGRKPSGTVVVIVLLLLVALWIRLSSYDDVTRRCLQHRGVVNGTWPRRPRGPCEGKLR
mmetsp:Transcript_3961/g.10955  ORF Transcript_3961/g.10955 Transcript_3961/m.10955 type:complete len:235 (-) Transcript_3961:271-975(-)